MAKHSNDPHSNTTNTKFPTFKVPPKIVGQKSGALRDAILSKLTTGDWKSLAQIGGKEDATRQHVQKLESLGKVDLKYGWSSQFRKQVLFVKLKEKRA